MKQSQDLEDHKKKIEDSQRERHNANNSSAESETASRPRSSNWGSHHDLRSVKLVMESNMAPPEGEEKTEGEKEETPAPIQGRILTNVFVPTRTQIFTVPPDGYVLTRRRFVIDETRRPTTAFCEFVDDVTQTGTADDRPNGNTPGAEGPEPAGEPKARPSCIPAAKGRGSPPAAAVGATAAPPPAAPPPTLPFSPSCSSLGPPPENPSSKSASPFSAMQTHSRSQLSLQLSTSNGRHLSRLETMDSPTLVVIDPSVEAILNERRPRSPSVPDTPTNSLSQARSKILDICSNIQKSMS